MELPRDRTPPRVGVEVCLGAPQGADRHQDLPGRRERAQAGTIRTRLLKLGAVIRVTLRRVRLSLSSYFPLQDVFTQVLSNIQGGYTALPV